MKLFDNPKPVLYGIVLFIVVLLLLFSIRARASDLAFEAGSAMVRGETVALGFNVNWREAGPVGTDYEVGFLLSGTSNHFRDNPNAITMYGALLDGYKNFELGLGFAFTNVDWEYTCNETFALLARWRFSERIAAQWRHFSSAGSCKPNAGRDFLTLAWRF